MRETELYSVAVLRYVFLWVKQMEYGRRNVITAGKIVRAIVLIGVLLWVLADSALPCTTFCFLHDGEWVYGRNYDWSIEHGMIFINKRGVAKQSMAEHNPARWVSKYGSITFNQYGRELPLGGMNEAGLVIECMWLDQTEYPHVDSREELGELQWIQYQLDNAATVEDVLASDLKVRISVRDSHPLHFLACDRAGGCAVVEFLSGKMVAYSGSDLPVTALTNSTYAYSCDFLAAVDGDESGDAFTVSSYSNKRFYWAAGGVRDWDPRSGKTPVDYAFEILDKVAIESTMFRIVYDVKQGRIYFTTRSNPSVRRVDFGAFDFSCDTPVRILDLAGTAEGNVTGMFTDYTFDDNYDLIKTSFSDTYFLQDVPDSLLRVIAAYPDSLRCAR